MQHHSESCHLLQQTYFDHFLFYGWLLQHKNWQHLLTLANCPNPNHSQTCSVLGQETIKCVGQTGEIVKYYGKRLWFYLCMFLICEATRSPSTLVTYSELKIVLNIGEEQAYQGKQTQSITSIQQIPISLNRQQGQGYIDHKERGICSQGQAQRKHTSWVFQMILFY